MSAEARRFREKAQEALDAVFSHTEHDGRVYDVFFWTSEGQLQYLSVPWGGTAKRSFPIKRRYGGTWTNATALPDGRPAGTATFAGSVYRGDPPNEDLAVSVADDPDLEFKIVE